MNVAVVLGLIGVGVIVGAVGAVIAMTLWFAKNLYR